MKVVKFGGSSLASGRQVEKVYHIVASDPERRIVVVSAPGKRFSEDIKVTDLLIECAEKALRGEETAPLVNTIVGRYKSIAEELRMPMDVISRITDDLLSLIAGNKLNPAAFIEAMKASGEDNNAKLVAAAFRYKGLDAHYVSPRDAGLSVSNEPGNASVLPESYERLARLKEEPGIVVFPGFFGYNTDNEVITFSRSGSDITGSILANAVQAELYENFTDVDAVYAVNPHIVAHPKEIRELTYREMRELSYCGFSVFHDEALIPAFRAGIKVNVKNTNNPEAPGTLIMSTRKNTDGPVVGIASDDKFSSIYISKYMMNKEIGFGRKVLLILEDFGLSFEHIPSGIDDLTVIIRQNQIDTATEKKVIDRMMHDLDADEVRIEHDLALIMLVGEGMRQEVGTAARASKALAEAKINIEMINQGSSETSMMFGVKEAVEKKAVQALYREFFGRAE
ncbi:aspartate kinase [Sporolactobacillus sp. CPB3-1]|uniref:Aspartokinase n=1 Tax=Sporolactobacillus mangiferae TaxID=2940498 RepID=A0ABT0MAE7_9BACL|nr:aspartate kinase [Sporolactobacillus mangiferae]MCL1631628.1 aspartate kinase [Sporolactobacillus mangiferae]